MQSFLQSFIMQRAGMRRGEDRQSSAQPLMMTLLLPTTGCDCVATIATAPACLLPVV